MPSRDAAEFDEASHWPDPAEACDHLDAHIAELVDAEWPRRADVSAKPAVRVLVGRVVKRLLDEGRLAPLVDVKRLPGRELLARLLAEIMMAEHPLLMAYCIDLVMQTHVAMGISMTEIGAKCGVEKATVSHHCVMLKEVYREGKPAPGMKSNAAVKSYQQIRTGRSSRGPRMDWAFAATFKNAYGNN